MKTLKISALWRPLMPAAAPSQLTREEAIKQARGAFKNYSGPSLEEMKRLDLEEEIAAEEREHHGNPD